MSWGTLTIGRLTLAETDSVDDKVNANDGTRTVVLTGTEYTFGKWTDAQLKAKAEDLVLLMDRVLPVTFSQKSERNGYYRITDAGVVSTRWQGEGSFFTWNLSLALIGPDNAVDIESRMTHVVRTNAHGIVGERWHAPAIGHYAYFLGAVAPTSITRATETGPMTIYRGIPAVNPRWGSPVGSFLSGAAKFADINGVVRSGVGIKLDPSWWELNNGLVRVRPASTAGTTLEIAFYDGAAWRETGPWDIRVAGSSILPASHLLAVHLVRNEPELVVVRLVALQPATSLRVTIDLMLRRGSRFVEGYLQRTAAGVLAVTPDQATPTTLSPGYFKANAPDVSGVSIVGGSSKTFVLANTGGVEVTGGTAMDFWIGAELAGAVAGDLSADLAKQYMAVPNEQTGVIVR